MNGITTTIRYVLLTALRDKLFTGLLAGVLLATYVASVMGSTALVETQEQTVVYAAGSARLILAIGLIVFVCFHIRNAFDTQEVYVILSRPMSRPAMVLAYWLGFAFVASLLSLPVIGLISYLGAGLNHSTGILAWSVSLVLEMWLVVGLALFSALILKSGVASVLSSLGFYVLGRLMAYFVATSQSSMGFEHVALNNITKWTLQGISISVPRLDFYGKTDWLVSTLPESVDWQHFLIQTAVFLPLLLLAAIADFRRKQF